MRYLILLLLAGCVSPEQIAQREINECQSMGFQYGTPSFSQCLLQIRMARKQANSQFIRDMNQNAAAGAPTPRTPSTSCYDTNVGIRCY